MSEEFDAIDELGKATHMPPKSTRDVLIVDPGRIAELEAKLQKWHNWERAWVFGPDEGVPWPGNPGTVDPVQTCHELEAEVERLREAAQRLIDDVPVCVCADHWKGIGRISPSCCRCHLQPELDELIAALEPQP